MESRTSFGKSQVKLRYNFNEVFMQIDQLRDHKAQLYKIAARYGISQLYIFGSVARGESQELSDIDFLIVLDESASVFGVGGFQYEAQKLLGVEIDVIPSFVLDKLNDRGFTERVQAEAIPL
jgi:predicted nucleotidyltransferase